MNDISKQEFVKRFIKKAKDIAFFKDNDDDLKESAENVYEEYAAKKSIQINEPELLAGNIVPKW